MSGAEPATRERWRRVSDTLSGMLVCPPEERTGLLERACRGDAALRAEVEELLAVDPALLAELDGPLVELGAAEPSSWPQVPGYELLAELGRGGMGEVYRARSSSGGGEVALKVLKRGLDTDEILTRFRIERNILSSLKHPHIVQLLDGGSTLDGRPFLVMELITGERLDHYAERLELDLPARLEIFLRICSAVSRAHESLVVHRDLKPANILVDPGGEPKLIDFGVAKLLDTSPLDPSTATSLAAAPMTCLYASPEQLAGEPVTIAADLYSLGVVFYELLTGKSPYGRASAEVAELRHAVLNGELVPAGRISRALAGDLEAILDKALARQPEHRYRSVEHLAEDLRRYLKGQPVEARPLPLGQRFGRWARRHAGLAAALGLGLVFLGGYLLERSRAHRLLTAELEQTRRLARFLGTVIVPSGTAAGSGAGASVHQLLDEGTTKVDSELAGEPLLQATALMSIGRAYHGLALYDEAERSVARARELRHSLLGADHPLTVDAVESLAGLAVARGRFVEAERLSLEVLAERQRAWSREDPRLVNAQVAVAALKMDTGYYRAAEKVFREVLARMVEHVGERVAGVGAIRGNLALALYHQDRISEAGTEARAALAISERALPPGHRQIQAHQTALSRVLAVEGDLTAAAALAQAALDALSREAAGDSHPAAATRWALRSEIAAAAGDLEEARQMARRAVAIWRQQSKVELHPNAAEALLALARAERLLGEGEVSSRLARQAVELREQRLRPDHPLVAEALLELARAEVAAGRGEEDARLVERARRILVAAGLEHHRWWRQHQAAPSPSR